MATCKKQFIMKYYSKFLVSSIYHFNFIKFKNIKEGLFKVEYLIKLSQYFENLAKAVMRSHNNKFLSKVSKILTEVDKVFNF